MKLSFVNIQERVALKGKSTDAEGEDSFVSGLGQASEGIRRKINDWGTYRRGWQ